MKHIHSNYIVRATTGADQSHEEKLGECIDSQWGGVSTLPSRHSSALRQWDVVKYSEVADSVPEFDHKKTADMDGRARGKRRGFSPGAAVHQSQLAWVNTVPNFLRNHLFS